MAMNLCGNISCSQFINAIAPITQYCSQEQLNEVDSAGRPFLYYAALKAVWLPELMEKFPWATELDINCGSVLQAVIIPRNDLSNPLPCLMVRGADVSVKYSGGRNLLHIIFDSFLYVGPENAPINWLAAVLSTLMDIGFDFRQHDNRGRTTLHAFFPYFTRLLEPSTLSLPSNLWNLFLAVTLQATVLCAEQSWHFSLCPLFWASFNVHVGRSCSEWS